MGACNGIGNRDGGGSACSNSQEWMLGLRQTYSSFTLGKQLILLVCSRYLLFCAHRGTTLLSFISVSLELVFHCSGQQGDAIADQDIQYMSKKT